MLRWLRSSQKPPSVHDVANRLAILKLQLRRLSAVPPPEQIAAAAAGWSEAQREHFRGESLKRRDGLVSRLRDTGLWRRMTWRERAFIEALPGEETPLQRQEATLCAEGAACLMWALGLIAEPPAADQPADPEPILALPGDAPAIVRLARPLPAARVEALRAFLAGEADSPLLRERRRALEWLAGRIPGNAWQDAPSPES